MPRLRLAMPSLIVATVLQTAVVHAGVFSFFNRQDDDCCCEERRKPKHQSCFCPPAPPSGEMAFAIPAVVRNGAAVSVSSESFRAGMQSAAAKEFARQSNPESGGQSTEERLARLENDVKELKLVTQQLTTVVEKLNQKIDAIPKN